MAERLTYENLKSKPYEAYLFSQQNSSIRVIASILGRPASKRTQIQLTRYTANAIITIMKPRVEVGAYSNIDKVLPLIGSGESHTKYKGTSLAKE